MTKNVLNEYVELRIAYAGASEWKDVEKMKLLNEKLVDMENENPNIESAFTAWYEECAKNTQVSTSTDKMAQTIKKHFSGKRVNI
jgi:hypothetical protein